MREGKFIRRDVAVPFGHDLVIRGDVEHIDAVRALVLHDNEEGGYEVLSTNLVAYGDNIAPGHVVIKDYSEHEGLAQRLVELGLVKIVDTLTRGPFDSRFHVVEVIGGQSRD